MHWCEVADCTVSYLQLTSEGIQWRCTHKLSLIILYSGLWSKKFLCFSFQGEMTLLHQTFSYQVWLSSHRFVIKLANSLFVHTQMSLGFREVSVVQLAGFWEVLVA